PADVDAVSVYPHAHYLGKTIEGSATRPDGGVVPLLRIASWNIRWQDQYRYRAPVPLPKGTVLRMRITYDNSAANGNNPAKRPRRVQWGPLSTDEMGALWLEVVPRRLEDVALLTRDYYARALAADVAAAELRLKTDPSSAIARNGLATRYLQMGRVDEAVTQLEQAIRLVPSDAEAHSNLGTALQLQGQMRPAMQHLREAVRLAPQDDRVRFNLGNALFAGGQLAEATREFRRAIELNPENEDAHFNLAMILGPQNQLDEAVALLRRVIDLNPQNAEAHRNLAVALGLQGRLEEAIARDQTALRLAPDSVQTRAHLTQLLQVQAARRPR
ncbi:MAG TPA: tetratricopeptide repeat protein, partial [Vicinamibacterales bacterium]